MVLPIIKVGVKMSDEKPTAEEVAAKAAREAAMKIAEDKATAINATRSGKGTRLLVGATRGRQSVPFTYEAWDKSKPETLVESVEDFSTILGIPGTDDGEKVMVNYLMEGYNEVSLTAASDPVSEYVDLTWDDDVQKRFRIVIRNYAENANVDIATAVGLIKPGISAAQEAAKAAKAAASAILTPA